MPEDNAFSRPRLETGRLILRRPQPEDRSAIIDAVGHFEVARGLSRVPHPYGDNDADFFLQEIVPREWVWAITSKSGGDLLGMVGLTPSPDSGTAELGYWIHRLHWGLGYATEAAAPVLRYGFETLALPTILAGPFESNPASARVLEKLGFTITGHSIRPCLALDRSVRSVEMRLDRD